MSAKTKGPKKKAASREGKEAVTVYVDPEIKRNFAEWCAKRQRTQEQGFTDFVRAVSRG